MLSTIVLFNSLSHSVYKGPTFLLPRDALQCKAQSCDHMSFVRLSVRLSVTLVDQDHIG